MSDHCLAGIVAYVLDAYGNLFAAMAEPARASTCARIDVALPGLLGL